jgi:hypothetical protein
MAIVKKVNQKLKVDILQTIKYQILTYCFFKDIHINESDLKLLAELAINNKIKLSKFCKVVTDKKIFKSEQSARNAINKAEKKNLLVKDGLDKKVIYINKDINVQSEGIVLLDIKILGSESQETQ